MWIQLSGHWFTRKFTTKDKTNASEIHSTPLIVLVSFILVNTTLSGGVNNPLTTASIIWYDVIKPVEWFTISIMRMPEYSQGTYMYVQSRQFTNNLHHVVLEKNFYKDHKIYMKFRAITKLSCVPSNPWLIRRINIQNKLVLQWIRH